MFRLEELNAPLARFVVPGRLLLYDGLRTALFTMIWPENDGRFSHRQLAFGTAAFVVLEVAWSIPILATGVLEATFRRRAVGEHNEEQGKDTGSPLDLHVLAPLVRYGQLTSSRVGARTADGPLLEHDPKDRLCPCPAPSCAGNVLRRTGWMQAAGTAAALIAVTAIYCILCMITQLITFAASTWGTWWRALIAVAASEVSFRSSQR
ncbi:hypothetical protein DFJ74DRAFT_59282 [Hyaloraphidium curvatum]|nr:hypothetical protein DFJ74DRAFT_59282 [Hyaloraphidium curvatum]